MIAQVPCFSLAALRVLGSPVYDWKMEEIRKEKSLNNIKGKQTLMPTLSSNSTHEHGEYHTCHTGGVLPTGVTLGTLSTLQSAPGVVMRPSSSRQYIQIN